MNHTLELWTYGSVADWMVSEDIDWPLHSQYMSTVGADEGRSDEARTEAMILCLENPEKAQEEIDAYRAALHAIADEAMAAAPEPAQPRARPRL